jgi:hypothetical protein
MVRNRLLVARLVLGVSLVAAGALGAGPAEAAAAPPSKGALAKRFTTITSDVNTGGSKFIYLTTAMIKDEASGAKIYQLAAHPFITVLELADRSLLAMGASGPAKQTLLTLVKLDRKTISELRKIQHDSASKIPAWQSALSNDAAATAMTAIKLRAQLAG